MKRDIDYAATAVRQALADKFERRADLNGLEVVAQERTILVRHGDSSAEGTRDVLMTAIRKSDSYDQFWIMVPQVHSDNVRERR